MKQASLLAYQIVISRIWSQVLDRPENFLPKQENFFLLGGNSLKMSQISSRLRQDLEIDLPLSTLFPLTTITRMSDFCHALKKKEHKEEHEDERLYKKPYVKQEQRNKNARNKTHPINYASVGQSSLWFIQQYDQESASLYNSGLRIDFTGKLKVDCLCRAYKQLILRHESLRAGFKLRRKSEGLEVCINENFISEIKCRQGTLPEVREEENCLITQPFDLSIGGLSRATLFQISKQHYVLLLVVHHIVTDGWSNNILMNEFSALYNRACNPLQNNLEPIKASYQEFCHWQNEFIHNQAYTYQLDYWLTQLKALPDQSKVHSLNSQNSQNFQYSQGLQSFQCFKKEVLEIEIEENLNRQLQDFCQQQNITAFMLHLTAFNLALNKLTGHVDIRLSTPVMNRQYASWEKVVGYYANIIVLRNQVQGNDTFLEFLNKVKSTVLTGLQHQCVPFAKVISALGLSGNENILVDTLFNYQSLADVKPIFNGIESHFQKIENPISNYKLSINVIEDSKGITYCFEYAQELLKDNSILLLSSILKEMLINIIHHPSQIIGCATSLLESPS